MANVMLLLLIITLSACGSQIKQEDNSPKEGQQTKTNALVMNESQKESNQERVSRIKGQVQATDGVFELSEDQDQKTLILFAQDTCQVCIQETKSILSKLKDPTMSPQNFRIYTILVGAEKETAIAWKKEHQVPWPVGFDPDADLFFTFSEEFEVPYALLHDPSKGIVYEARGHFNLNEIDSLIGKWE